jgi:hypothetical protein
MAATVPAASSSRVAGPDQLTQPSRSARGTIAVSFFQPLSQIGAAVRCGGEGRRDLTSRPEARRSNIRGFPIREEK